MVNVVIFVRAEFIKRSLDLETCICHCDIGAVYCIDLFIAVLHCPLEPVIADAVEALMISVLMNALHMRPFVV